MTAPDDGERAEILAAIAALVEKLGHKHDLPGQLNGELASLREEIASLRQQIAAQSRGCCHHSCWHYCYPITTTVTYPQTWTVGTGGTYAGGITYYNTGGAIS